MRLTPTPVSVRFRSGLLSMTPYLPARARRRGARTSVRPKSGISLKRNWRSAAQPARAGRSDRPARLAREDSARVRLTPTPVSVRFRSGLLSMTPYLPARARRRGARTSVRPKSGISLKRNWRSAAQPARAGRSDRPARLAREDSARVRLTPTPVSVRFRSGLLSMTPYLPARARRRGARTSVRPKSGISLKRNWRSAAQPARAGRSDRPARLAREDSARVRLTPTPVSVRFRSGLLSMTPYLPARARRRGARTSVRPKSGISLKRNWRSAAQPARAGRSDRPARLAREDSARVRLTPTPVSVRFRSGLLSMTPYLPARARRRGARTSVRPKSGISLKRNWRSAAQPARAGRSDRPARLAREDSARVRLTPTPVSVRFRSGLLSMTPYLPARARRRGARTSVRPKSGISLKRNWRSAAQPARAGRSDRPARLAREDSARVRLTPTPVSVRFRSGLLSMTPYLPARARRRGARTSVRPKSGISLKRNWRSAAQPARAGRSDRPARLAREDSARVRLTPTPVSVRFRSGLLSMTPYLPARARRRGARTSVRPKSGISLKRNWRSAAQPARAGRSDRPARLAREDSARVRLTPFPAALDVRRAVALIEELAEC